MNQNQNQKSKNQNTPAPEPQPQPDISFDDCYPAPPWVNENRVENMSRAESLDILYQIAAKAKQQIASGYYYTPEEMRLLLEVWKREDV